MDELTKQLSEVMRKAERYDSQKTRYTEIADKIKKGIALINEAIEELDPYTTTSTRKITGVKFDKIISEFYLLIQAGTEISIPVIKKTYPELNNIQHYYIMKQLSQKPNVDKRKEGVKVYLFNKK
jgi:hypothetical protein